MYDDYSTRITKRMISYVSEVVEVLEFNLVVFIILWILKKEKSQNWL